MTGDLSTGSWGLIEQKEMTKKAVRGCHQGNDYKVNNAEIRLTGAIYIRLSRVEERSYDLPEN